MSLVRTSDFPLPLWERVARVASRVRGEQRGRGLSSPGSTPSSPTLLPPGEKGERRAYTLIEMMIAMTIVVGLMGTLGALVSQVITANSASAEHLDDVAALGALGRQFRGDVRVAAKVAISQPDAAVQILSLTTRDGTTIEYKIDGATLQRAGTSATASRPLRREAFAFNTMHFIGWKQEGNEVALTIARTGRAPADVESTAMFDMVAVLGGDILANLSP